MTATPSTRPKGCPHWCGYHSPDGNGIVHVGKIIRCGDRIAVTPIITRFQSPTLADLNRDAVAIDGMHIPLDIAGGLAQIFTRVGRADIADAIWQSIALLKGGEES